VNLPVSAVQERTGLFGNAAMQQSNEAFFENTRLFLKMQGFFKNALYFKDIFREFEAFLK
jgi:hypothetical protein